MFVLLTPIINTLTKVMKQLAVVLCYFYLLVSREVRNGVYFATNESVVPFYRTRVIRVLKYYVILILRKAEFFRCGESSRKITIYETKVLATIAYQG
jgi:hypothetical protein